MLVLDSGDKIRGDASAATVVDYTLHGLDNNVFKQLADGQLADSIGDLYPADSVDLVTAIILVNTDSSARTINLYLTPSGGTARRLIPKDFSLGAGYALLYDGAKATVLNTTGGIVTSFVSHASNHTDGTDDVQSATSSQKGLATAAQITKLDGIDTGAKDDQTGAEIKAAYEAEADTNAYDDAAVSKLGGIEASADVTDDLNVGGVNHAASNKATPVNADKVPLVDTEASNVIKTSTWTNIKAFLKTYFDTLYNKYTLETHASNHTDGTDDIQSATDAQKGLATSTQIAKLDGIAAGADVTGSNPPQAHHDSHDPEDGSDALDCAAPGTNVTPEQANAEGSAHSLSRSDHMHYIPSGAPSELAGVQAAAEGSGAAFARIDHAHQIQASIADNHLVTMDDADAAEHDYCKLTTVGIVGRSYDEVLADLSGQAGAAFNWNDQSIQRANLLDCGIVTNAIGSIGGGAQEINMEAGNSVSATVDTSETTFTFADPTGSDELCIFALFLTNGGSQTVNWPASVQTNEGDAMPTLTASGLDMLVYATIDGGTIWVLSGYRLDIQAP